MTTDRPVTREIITKAVCGKGTYKYQRSIDLEIPVTQKNIQVLGSFLSNAAVDEATVIDSARHGKAVQVKGHYDVHIWYAYDLETRAVKTTVTFIEKIPIQIYGGESISSPKADAEIIKRPYCRKAYVKNLGDKTIIRVEIEQELAAEVIGLTKLKIGTASPVMMTAEPVTGRELLPPQNTMAEYVSPIEDYFLDLKCEEDLPEEDDEDYEYSRNDYDG